MPRRVLTALLALALASSSAPQLAHADNPDFAGLTCGLMSRHVSPFDDPRVRRGVLVGGPLAAADVVDDSSSGGSHRELVRIELQCWVQFNDATNDAAHAASAASDVPWKRHVKGEGTTALVTAGSVHFAVPSFGTSYLCAWARFIHANRVNDVFHDADSRRPGNQCTATTL